MQRGEGRRAQNAQLQPLDFATKTPLKSKCSSWSRRKGKILRLLSKVFMCSVKCRNPRALPCLWGQVCSDTLSRLLDKCPAAPYWDEAAWQPTLTLTSMGLVLPSSTSSSSFPRHIVLASLLCWLWHSCAWAGSQVWIWKMISFLLISVSWTASARGQRSAGVGGGGGRLPQQPGESSPCGMGVLTTWVMPETWGSYIIPEVWTVGCWERCGAPAWHQSGPSHLGNPHDSLWGQQGSTWSRCVCCHLELFWKVCDFAMCGLHYWGNVWVLSAVLVLLCSHFGEITTGKDISWDLEVGGGVAPLKIKLN